MIPKRSKILSLSCYSMVRYLSLCAPISCLKVPVYPNLSQGGAASSVKKWTCLDCTWFLTPYKPKNEGEAASMDAPFPLDTCEFPLTGMGSQSPCVVHCLPSTSTWSSYTQSMGIDKGTPLLLGQRKGSLGMYYAYRYIRDYVGHKGPLACSQVPLEDLDVDQACDVDSLSGVATVESAKTGGSKQAKYDGGAQSGEYDPELGGWGAFVDMDFVKKVVNGEEKATIVDVRSWARFTAEQKEARKGVRSGHMPGSVNLPFPRVLKDDYFCSLKSPSDLTSVLSNVAGNAADKKRTIISCGSGVTACIVAAAMEKAGYDKDCIAVYDGSWAEWANENSDTVVLTGE